MTKSDSISVKRKERCINFAQKPVRHLAGLGCIISSKFLDGFIVNLFSEKIVQVSTEYLTEASSHPNELYLQAYCANDLSWQ